MAIVWQLSVISLSSKSLIKGVILEKNPFVKKERISRLKHLLMLIKSYRTKPLINSELSINIENKSFSVVTNANGTFELEIDVSYKKEPKISIWFQDVKLESTQEYPIFFSYKNTKIDVISDIDDTILISHTASAIKRIGVLSLVPSYKRKTILLTKKLLELINNTPTNVYYVSKSESNLFAILNSFIIKNKLPKGALLLTPYLNFRQLLKGKKGKDFKLNTINFIIKNSLDKKFILFGDDTQKDMEVYASIVKSFPNKIERIYIRQTKKQLSKQKITLLKNLRNSFPKTIYFNEETDINVELKEVEKLIELNT
jgi:phosphatidate phosphatase APP1